MKREKSRGAESPLGAYRAVARFYDAEYADKKYLRRDVPFLLKCIGRRKERILEVGCGTGRAAIELAAAGHDVVGIDFDPEMIRLAERKVRRGKIEFAVADAMELERSQPWGTFDRVVILFNTFLNFVTPAAQDAVMRGTVRQLNRGGRLWVDVFYPDMAMICAGTMHGLDMVEFEADGRRVGRQTDIAMHVKLPQVQVLTNRYAWVDDAGKSRNVDNVFFLRWMYPREIELLLRAHGFEPVGWWGSHRGAAVERVRDRIIVEAILK